MTTDAVSRRQSSGARLAEREGFEPSVEFPLHTLSKRAPSTTRPSLQMFRINSLRRVWWPETANCVANCVRPLNVPRSLTGISPAKLASEAGTTGHEAAHQYSRRRPRQRTTVRAASPSRFVRAAAGIGRGASLCSPTEVLVGWARPSALPEPVRPCQRGHESVDRG